MLVYSSLIIKKVKKITFIFNVDEAMTSDKEYDFSMVAGEFVEVYSK